MRFLEYLRLPFLNTRFSDCCQGCSVSHVKSAESCPVCLSVCLSLSVSVCLCLSLSVSVCEASLRLDDNYLAKVGRFFDKDLIPPVELSEDGSIAKGHTKQGHGSKSSLEARQNPMQELAGVRKHWAVTKSRDICWHPQSQLRGAQRQWKKV